MIDKIFIYLLFEQLIIVLITIDNEENSKWSRSLTVYKFRNNFSSIILGLGSGHKQEASAKLQNKFFPRYLSFPHHCRIRKATSPHTAAVYFPPSFIHNKSNGCKRNEKNKETGKPTKAQISKL